MTPDEFQSATAAPPAAMERLARYVAVLGKWQARMNLVGPGTLDDVWRRHLLDSAQLLPLLPANAGALIDLGSGAGLPGLVLAAFGVADVHLVESSVRKCAFLREAARDMGVDVTVHQGRIEALRLPANPGTVVARAVAPLPRLLGLAAPLCGRETRCLFLKGQDVGKELTEAAKSWNMRYRLVDSISDPAGRIVVLEGFERV